MKTLFFWILVHWVCIWSILGGLIPALLVAGHLWSTPQFKIPTRIFFGVILGPSMWIVQFVAGVIATIMYVIHSFSKLKSAPFPPIPKPPKQEIKEPVTVHVPPPPIPPKSPETSAE